MTPSGTIVEKNDDGEKLINFVDEEDDNIVVQPCKKV